MLKLYNTLTRQIEVFKPMNPPEVIYYSCGPTVYDYAHIGHARTYVFADILHRVLEFSGYQVKRVMNITDVGHLTSDMDTGEDKVEKKARSEDKSVWEIADYYTKDFFALLDKLNIIRPEIIYKATDCIDEMIKLVKILEKKGFTYKLDDGIYFDTSKFKKYGRLTGRTFEKLKSNLRAGARVKVVKGKKNITDFALWKFSPKDKKRQMEWNSPWGKGFPGWHIECSAMSMKVSQTLDIHTGGVEHIPVHHTNEIAQSEVASGKTFVRYWLHADHLLVNGKKMSKSLGNFYRLKDIEKKGISTLALRYLFLTAHYRIQMNFTWKSLKSAARALISLKENIKEIQRSASLHERTTLKPEKLEKIDNFRNRFVAALENDLNTAEAIAVLWQVVKSNIAPSDKYELILLFDEVFGLNLKSVKAVLNNKIPEKIEEMARQREKFRKAKDFNKADEIRKEIEDKGFILEDSSQGPRIKSKK